MREPSKGFTRELQVGLFIFAACLVIAAFSFRITDSPIFRRGSTFVTYLDDATGVFRNSKVKLSGIDIGVIRKIELEDGKAKITIIIDQGVEVPANSKIVPRPLGILGDKFLDVVLPNTEKIQKPDPNIPGTEPHSRLEKNLLEKSLSAPGQNFWGWLGVPSAQAGIVNDAEAQTTLKSATGIGQATDSKGTKVLSAVNSPATLDDLTRQLGKVGEDLKAISGSLRNMVEGEGNVNSPVGRTLRNAEALSRNLNDVVVENRKDVRSIVKSLDAMSQKLNETVASFDQKKMSQDLKNLSEAAGNMSKTVANLEEITSRIANGEGSLGRLVNDDSIAVEFERTLRTVNQALDRAQRTLTVVEMRSEYLEKSSETKTYVGLGIYPREDAGYLGYVVIDPRGTVKKTITTETVDAGVPKTTTTVVNDKDKMKFSIEYFRRFGDLGLRLGLIESTGGVGFDFFLLGDRVKIGAELFDFSRDGERGNLKAYVDVGFLSYFHLVGGGNELMAKGAAGSSVQKSYYAGLGLRFTDEDLKTVLLLPKVN